VPTYSLGNYFPILVVIILTLLIGWGIVIASHLVGPRRKGDVEKGIPYEGGMDPIGSPRQRFFIRFYIVAVLFLLFDIETVFLYPWAVLFRKLGLFGFVEMLIFIAILFVGFIYVWKKGALEWA